MDILRRWRTFSDDLGRAAYELVGAVKLPISEKEYSDEKVLALLLLARTISHLKGARILLDEKRIVEARTITRCCFENWFWVVSLRQEGEAFAQKMLHDTLHHRRARGQFLFNNRLEMPREVEQRLRAWMRNTSKEFPNLQSLSPSDVAKAAGDNGKSYIFYAALSSDAAHPSVDALNRYIISKTDDDEIGVIDFEPPVTGAEAVETLQLLCMSVSGVGIAVREIVYETNLPSMSLDQLAQAYMELSAETDPLHHPRSTDNGCKR
jgi:hypothetical protein